MLEIAKRVCLIMIGLLLTTLGLKVLLNYHLTFGGTAGFATLLTFSTDLPWSLWFFLVNLPFFLISILKIGKGFTIYSLLSITMISIIDGGLNFLPPLSFPLWTAPILAGFFIGIGVTLVLNNGSSLGGIHILAMYIEQKWKFNRGYVIFACDVFIIVVAIQMVGLQSALLSIVTIFIASFIIGRYKKAPLKTEDYSMAPSTISEHERV